MNNIYNLHNNIYNCNIKFSFSFKKKQQKPRTSTEGMHKTYSINSVNTIIQINRNVLIHDIVNFATLLL